MTWIDQLKRDEGWKARPYTDTMGNVTIGYGTNLSEGITPDEGQYLMEGRADRIRVSLLAAFPWASTLDDARFGVLWNMAYNMGVHGLMKFTYTLASVAAKDWEAAATNMLASQWAQQVGDRATRLAEQMRTGIWQMATLGT